MPRKANKPLDGRMSDDPQWQTPIKAWGLDAVFHAPTDDSNWRHRSRELRQKCHTELSAKLHDLAGRLGIPDDSSRWFNLAAELAAELLDGAKVVSGYDEFPAPPGRPSQWSAVTDMILVREVVKRENISGACRHLAEQGSIRLRNGRPAAEDALRRRYHHLQENGLLDHYVQLIRARPRE
jgi:hypothetical protein